MGLKLKQKSQGWVQASDHYICQQPLFSDLGNITNIQLDEVVQQPQITVDECSGGLR